LKEQSFSHTNEEHDSDRHVSYCLTRKFCVEEVVVKNDPHYSIHLHVNGTHTVL